MKKHSFFEKIIHKIYLNNFFISKASLEFEKEIFSKKINSFDLDQIIFVTGLARSGSTSILRKIHSTNQYASLQYNNMPFLFLPNFWNNKHSNESTERAHNDGIMVNNNSPEEFDEYFWKVYLNNSNIKNKCLIEHDLSQDIITDYIKYAKLIAISKSSKKYITKNNNNVLRLNSLLDIKNSFFLVLVRNPLDHASSLLKLHRKFTELHKKDSFSLQYFDFLGHHEFGLNHKPFIFSDTDLGDYNKDSIDYWIKIWINYYSFILRNYKTNFEILIFEDLINSNKPYDRLNQILNVNIQLTKFQPPLYNQKVSQELYNESILIYNDLKKQIKY